MGRMEYVSQVYVAKTLEFYKCIADIFMKKRKRKLRGWTQLHISFLEDLGQKTIAIFLILKRPQRAVP